MKKDIPRLFLDSNIWFSALWGSINCEKLIHAHLKGKIKAVVSNQVIEETIRNIQEKRPQSLILLQDLLINNPPEIIRDQIIIKKEIINLIDEKDRPIFGSAILGRVKYFVTGNIKDFSVKKLEKMIGIKIITPKEAVDIFDL